LLLRGLSKAFADVQAVDGLDLEVAPGECFGLLGPNGAGKTTTIEICEGLTDPDEGTVELLGLNWTTGANQLRQRIGIQLQETQFPEKLTVEETLRLFRSFFRHGVSVDESIRTAQLEEKRGSRVGGLSGGQKQRLAMACALVGDPELLFLDHGRVIALGTPKQLIATVGGEDIVEFAVTHSEPGAQHSVRGVVNPAQLMAIPGVQSHRVDAALHQLSVSELHTTVPRIFAALAAEGLHLSEFRTHSATLEDVFVRLTGRNLRDE
jgi:ABC-2 type transport system ATP-binding protein